MSTMPCQYCGECIDLSKYRTAERAVRLYCSRTCATRMNNVLVPKRGRLVGFVYGIPEKNADGAFKSCMVCSAERSSLHNSLFCSTDCMSSFWATYQEYKEELDAVSSETAKSRSRRLRESRKKKCPHCDTMIHSGSKACNTHKWIDSTVDRTIDKWISGEWTGQYGPKTPHVVSDIVRKYLYELCDFSCTKCGFSKSHPDDGSPILQINHIDGDATNHSQNNLEVLCPNCHAMTPNYGRRNKNSTRPRRDR